jgi:hypothetical protein
MREVVVLSHCDRCWVSTETKVPAVGSHEVQVDSHRLEMDLCSQCDALLLDPVRVLISGREAAEAAAKRAAGATAGQGTRKDHKVYCGTCRSWVGLRARSTHAKDHHNVADPGKILWAFGPDVDKVWVCSCGLPFPTDNGALVHNRRLKHGRDTDVVAKEPLRVHDLHAALSA